MLNMLFCWWMDEWMAWMHFKLSSEVKDIQSILLDKNALNVTFILLLNFLYSSNRIWNNVSNFICISHGHSSFVVNWQAHTYIHVSIRMLMSMAKSWNPFEFYEFGIKLVRHARHLMNLVNCAKFIPSEELFLEEIMCCMLYLTFC